MVSKRIGTCKSSQPWVAASTNTTQAPDYQTEEHEGADGELVLGCQISGIDTLHELDSLLREDTPPAKGVFEAVFNSHAEDVDPGSIVGSREHYTTTMVFVRSGVDLDLVEEMTEYSDTYYEGLRRARDATRPG